MWHSFKINQFYTADRKIMYVMSLSFSRFNIFFFFFWSGFEQFCAFFFSLIMLFMRIIGFDIRVCENEIGVSVRFLLEFFKKLLTRQLETTKCQLWLIVTHFIVFLMAMRSVVCYFDMVSMASLELSGPELSTEDTHIQQERIFCHPTMFNFIVEWNIWHY